MRFLALIIVVLCFKSLGFSAQASVYFSEQVDLSEKFIEMVREETRSIRLAVHRLSDVRVIQALVEAFRRGVDVQVLVDPVTLSRKTPLKLLTDEGVGVYVWNFSAASSKKRSSLHHSFCLFGLRKIWTGSMSFSVKRLFCHRENVLVLQDEKILQDFSREFREIKAFCVPLQLYRKSS